MQHRRLVTWESYPGVSATPSPRRLTTVSHRGIQKSTKNLKNLNCRNGQLEPRRLQQGRRPRHLQTVISTVWTITPVIAPRRARQHPVPRAATAQTQRFSALSGPRPLSCTTKGKQQPCPRTHLCLDQTRVLQHKGRATTMSKNCTCRNSTDFCACLCLTTTPVVTPRRERQPQSLKR